MKKTKNLKKKISPRFFLFKNNSIGNNFDLRNKFKKIHSPNQTYFSRSKSKKNNNIF